MNSGFENAGARIRELREINRYSREEFAEIAEISSKFLYEIETGQKGFSADTLLRIANGLSVNCEYILTGSDQETCSDEVIRTMKLFSNSQMKTVVQILKLIYELGTKS